MMTGTERVRSQDSGSKGFPSGEDSGSKSQASENSGEKEPGWFLPSGFPMPKS